MRLAAVGRLDGATAVRTGASNVMAEPFVGRLLLPSIDTFTCIVMAHMAMAGLVMT